MNELKLMKVNVYCRKYVQPEHRLKFMRLMEAWADLMNFLMESDEEIDGCSDVGDMLYDIGVLKSIHEDAKS